MPYHMTPKQFGIIAEFVAKVIIDHPEEFVDHTDHKRKETRSKKPDWEVAVEKIFLLPELKDIPREVLENAVDGFLYFYRDQEVRL